MLFSGKLQAAAKAFWLVAALVVPCAALPLKAGEVKLNVDTTAPWGKLTRDSIFLEAPASLVAQFPHPSTTTSWILPEARVPEVKAILEKSMAPPQDVEAMFAPGRSLRIESGVVHYPGSAILHALRMDERSAIYRLLAKVPENEYHSAPLVVTQGDLAHWFRGSNLPKPMQAMVEKYLWKDGTHLFFSDVHQLMSTAKGQREITQVMQHMTRTEALRVQLELTSQTDLEAVQRYWQPGRTRTDAASIVASLRPAKVGEKNLLDVAHLLPPHVRQQLYAYPQLKHGAIGRFPDCHWTSLNFFEESPREYYIDTAAAARELQENYTKVTTPMALGDVLLFRNGGQGLHSCVYVAEDIVFSKNGSNLVHPWVLCSLDHVTKTYHDIPNLEVDVLRKKNLVQ